MQEGIGELKVGMKVKSQGRTISEGDFTTMVNLAWETGVLHTDREYMKTTQFGERILGGPCIVPFVPGLSGKPLGAIFDRSGIRPVALVGINSVHFTAPLHPGDTIWVETEVTSLRPTAKEGRFLMFMKDVLHKQDGRVILDMERVLLIEGPR